MQQEIENGNFKTMKRTCTKLGRDVTLGSRGCFFLSILIVRGKAASTRLEAPRALLNCKHGLFHIRYFENGSLEQG